MNRFVKIIELFIGDEPFVVLLADDIMVSNPPAPKQMIDVYEQTGKQVIGTKPVPGRGSR
jgi:UTP--glucose-1-phosphate uridylyltransferase